MTDKAMRNAAMTQPAPVDHEPLIRLWGSAVPIDVETAPLWAEEHDAAIRHLRAENEAQREDRKS